jgi:hypothetical protein
MPLSSWPPESRLENNKSAMDNTAKVEDFLFMYEAAGCIVATDEVPHLVLPLSLVFSNKHRLVVDGSRNLNPFLRKRPVKLSHLESANQGLKQGSWFATCDLESGYHQVLVTPEQRILLGIAWTKNGKKQHWLWRTLFLGVRDAVYIFSKLLRAHIAYCSKLGFWVILYIDDMRVVGASASECDRFFNLAMDCLKNAGWKIKDQKGIWIPTQKGEFLGLVHDTVKMLYYVPERKMDAIISMGEWLLTEKKAKVRTIAKFYGKVAACQLALGPCVSLLAREGQKAIGEGSEISWNYFIILSDELKSEIKSMIELMPSLNGFPIHQKTTLSPSRVLASDASNSGVAGLEVRCGSESSSVSSCNAACADSLIVHRRFSAFELVQSSTYREMVALWELYFIRVHIFKGQSILHYSDNTNVPIILRKGSGNPLLQSMALDIFKACHKNQVSLFGQWVPRTHSHLLLPDYYSRTHDLADWGLTNEALEFVISKCPFNLTVDLFANEYNRRLPCFFSKLACPSTSGVNAFAQRWDQFGPGLCVPPPDLITGVISHIIECRSVGLLIVPLWRSADFWISLCPDGRHINSIFFDGAKEHLPLISAEHLNKVFSGIPSFPMLYLLYDGACEQPNVSLPDINRCIFNGCDKCQ